MVDTAILAEHYRGPRYATVEDFRREMKANPPKMLKPHNSPAEWPGT